MLKATPAGLAEQAAGGGGRPKGNSAKKATVPKRQQCQKGKKQKNCQNRQAGRRKEEKRGRRWERRKAEESAEALWYEWLSAVTRCRIRTVLGLDLTLRRERPIFSGQAPGLKNKHIKSTIRTFPSRHCALLFQAVLQQDPMTPRDARAFVTHFGHSAPFRSPYVSPPRNYL